MIKLTKLNDEVIFVNISYIVMMEMIPETKLILKNKEHVIVQESPDDIIRRIYQDTKDTDTLSH